jgi:hypothetical protein
MMERKKWFMSKNIFTGKTLGFPPHLCRIPLSSSACMNNGAGTIHIPSAEGTLGGQTLKQLGAMSPLERQEFLKKVISGLKDKLANLDNEKITCAIHTNRIRAKINLQLGIALSLLGQGNGGAANYFSNCSNLIIPSDDLAGILKINQAAAMEKTVKIEMFELP